MTGKTVRRCGDPTFDVLIWRYIRDEGGWHTAHEIRQALALDSSGAMRLAHTLRRLKRGLHIASRPDVYGRECYGVTTACWPVEGETLQPDPVG
ncbi:MAG: hypothetical protein Fur0019_17350 [Tibeticola sp.]